MNEYRYSNLTKPQRELSKSAVYFFMKKMCPRLKNKISLRIIGVKELSKKEGINGDCDILDVENKYPREFVIRLDSSSNIKLYLKSLMHEMVHMKQFARRELIHKGPVFRWQGQIIDPEKIDYWDHPWEIEAHGRETGLLYQFLCKNEDMRSLYFKERRNEGFDTSEGLF